MSTLNRSTLSALTECADFQSLVSVVPNRILCGALTGNDEHLALSGELFTHNSYKKL